MNKNIEVEGGEIAIQNESGDIAIIPIKDVSRVKKMLKNPSELDEYVSGLPKMADYAEDGSLVYQIWEERTGTPWKSAKEQGLTTGSYDDNMALRRRMLAGEFDKQPSGSDGDEFKKSFKATPTAKPSQSIEGFEKPVKDRSADLFDNSPNTPTAKPSNSINGIEKDPNNKANSLFDKVIDNAPPSKDKTEISQSAKPSKTIKGIKEDSENKVSTLFDKAISKAKSPEIINELKKTRDKVLNLDKDSSDYYQQKKALLELTKDTFKRLREQESRKVEENKPGIFDSASSFISESISGISKNVSDSMEGISDTIDDGMDSLYKYVDNAKHYAHKLAMEKVPGYETEESESEVENIVKEKFIPKKIDMTDNFKNLFDEEIGYKGKTHLNKDGTPARAAKSNIHTYSNAFDNKKGYDYTPIPNVKNHVDKTYDSPGVAHFLLDSDVSQKEGYKHKFSQNYINKQLKGENIQPGSTVENQYFPVYTKKANGKVNVKYKTKDEIVTETKSEINYDDNLIPSMSSDIAGANGDASRTQEELLSSSTTQKIAAPLRQYKYSDLDWNSKSVVHPGFNGSVYGVPTKSKDKKGNVIASHLVHGKGAKTSYGQFNGTSVVFIINKDGERLIMDYADSVQNIQNKAQSLINKYGIKEEDLIIGMHDLGSFNAKPAGKNNKLKYDPSDFNPREEVGGALAF